MHSDDVAVYAALKNLHAELYPRIKALREVTARCGNPHLLADRAYAIRKALEFLNDVRKELGLLNEMSEKLACLVWTQLGETEPIRTEYTTATANVKMMGAMPKRAADPEGYDRFMQHLGVPRSLYADEEEAVRPHWPGMVEYLSKLVAEGKPLPPGVDPNKTYPVYTLTCRPRKEVDEPPQ